MHRTVVALDTETSLYNTVGKFKANPHHPDNWIVWAGVAVIHRDGLPEEPALRKFTAPSEVCVRQMYAPGEVLYVGHNISFDIHYLCHKNNKYRDEWIVWLNDPASLIWDTQLAEYRLSGQTSTSPSLDSCCEARNWPTKPGRLKEYWANGISTENIPDHEVVPYLQHDVKATAALFTRQLLEARELGILPMMLVEMKSRMTTTLMEHNGMAFDSDAAIKVADDVLEPKAVALMAELVRLGRTLSGLPCDAAVSPNSPVWLATLLYGGEFKWKEQRPMVDTDGNPTYFKTGKRKGEPRMRWEEFRLATRGQAPSVPYTGTNEDTLEKIMVRNNCPDDLREFLEKVLAYRDIGKQLSTYFRGYSMLTFPDGMIHGNLNHAITGTGRLSSSSPNLQNAAHSPIRQHFRSRYKNGKLLEVDLSQIEVVVQAVLSQDTNMIADIRHKIDFHSKRAAFAHKVDYEFVKEAATNENHPEHKVWKQRRKDAKIVSFQKAYGAGVKKISATTGLSHTEVQAFMEAEDSNYPRVPITQAAWIESVEKSAGNRNGRISGELISPTRTRYRFFQQDFNGHLTFKPTEIKNYPIQGLSADILKIILSELRSIVTSLNSKTPDAQPMLIVQTVHDSVVFDVPEHMTGEQHLKEVAKVLIDYFCKYPVNVLRDRFGFNFNCPISASAEVGTDWLNKTEV